LLLPHSEEPPLRILQWLKPVLAAGLFAATGLFGPEPAQAQKSADTLRVYWRDQIADVDPYYNNMRTGLIFAHHAFDGLIYRDPESMEMKPLLATSWKLVDPTTLEFELRQGVTFHNGDKFTAADVVYTIKTITDPKSGIVVPSNFNYISSAETIDDYHVRLKLKAPFPPALEYLAFVTPIYPAAYRERVGHDGFKKEPVGTGPYKVNRIDGVNLIDMERYEGYFGGPKGRPPIKRLVIHEVADATTELTALLGGQADWIWQFNPDQFDKIAAMPTLTTLRHDTMRIIHLTIDAAGRSSENSPLRDVRVRRAIMHAIDRQTFARQLVQGGARVPDGPCYFSQTGCNLEAEMHYDYDPAKAKALLAEAGYPDGFDTEIVNSLLPQWAGAVQNYLRAVGIRARVTTLQSSAATLRTQKGDAPMNMASWGSNSINDISAIMPYFFGGGMDDMAKDTELTRMLVEAAPVADPVARKAAYGLALKRETEQAYWVPLSTSVTVYGISRQLNFKAYQDEMPRFFQASWK
jgi:peptide/nickel transport system substrate-binding protein